jgi:putative nucleotidyltransferase with HDIG domain
MADIKRLEAMPQVVLKALELINDPRSTPQQLADTLAFDQSLAVRVLNLASSAYYGSTWRSLSLREALVRVGFNAVRSLVVTTSVSPTLNRSLPGYMLDHGQLWRHSIATGMCARNIASLVGYVDREEAYIAGLLHDIGKLIVDSRLSRQPVPVSEVAGQNGIPLHEAERLLLGFDHAQIGALVIEKWQLSARLAEAVAYHHAPLKAPEMSLLPSITYLADVVATMAGVPGQGNLTSMTADYEVISQLGLDAERVDSLLGRLHETLGEVDQFLRLSA